eukprot:SAG11_NODE_4207_length_2013_cov_34.543365_1_plen_329_part_00
MREQKKRKQGAQRQRTQTRRQKQKRDLKPKPSKPAGSLHASRAEKARLHRDAMRQPGAAPPKAAAPQPGAEATAKAVPACDGGVTGSVVAPTTVDGQLAELRAFYAAHGACCTTHTSTLESEIQNKSGQAPAPAPARRTEENNRRSEVAKSADAIAALLAKRAAPYGGGALPQPLFVKLKQKLEEKYGAAPGKEARAAVGVQAKKKAANVKVASAKAAGRSFAGYDRMGVLELIDEMSLSDAKAVCSEEGITIEKGVGLESIRELMRYARLPPAVFRLPPAAFPSPLLAIQRCGTCGLGTGTGSVASRCRAERSPARTPRCSGGWMRR